MQAGNLSEAADFISQNKEDLVTAWESRARKEMSAAESPQTEILRNHMVALLDDLQESLRNVDPSTSARSASENAFRLERSQRHGFDRAEETEYRVDQVLEDYVILRQVITDKIETEGLSDLRTVEAINRMFELASLSAVKSFTQLVRNNQEKMFATLVHDVRSPLTVATSALKMLGEKWEGTHTDDEFYPMVERSLDRALTMISGLLDVFSEEAKSGLTLTFEEVDLVEVFERTVVDLKQVYGENLKWFLPSHPVKGVFARGILIRILENLISNAFKHGSPNSPVCMELKIVDKESVTFWVHNEGKPIPKDKQKEIFEIFNSTEPNGSDKAEGWGVGLTHVKLAARAHGGTVDLTSNDEIGTTFYVNIKKHSQQPGTKRFSVSDD